MSDIVEFLRARLDEDEKVARAAQPGPWTWTPPSRDERVDPDDPAWRQADANGAYLGLFHSARVLAEVEAKRRIVDEHHPVDPCDAHDAALNSVVCDTIKLLAGVYADHEDYDPSWRPES